MRYVLVLVLAGVAGLAAVAWASDRGKGGFSAANYGGGGGSGTPVQSYPSGGGGFDAPVVVGAAGEPARR